MGVSQETDVALAGELMYEAVEPVFEDVVRVAHLNRPDLYRAELAVRLQEQAVRVARSAYWPRLDATFTQGWARPDPHASTKDEWGDSWVAGVELELPLFDGLARKGRLVQERAILERRRIERKDAEERVLLDIQQALLALRDAAEFVESQRLNLDRAQEGLRLAEVGYQQGIHTEVAIADARAALTQARGLYYQSIYDHTSARIALQRAMGVLGPGREDAGLAAPGMDNIPNAADLTPNDTHVEPIPPKAGEHEEDAE
jgi:outer membrane protein TolC